MSGTAALMIAPLALLWAGGAVLFFPDGRKRAVAWSAVAVLGVALAVSAALLWRTLAAGPAEVITGGWPAGVGIRLRGDALGSLFTALSLLSILAALVHETAEGIGNRAFPALALLLSAGLTGLFLTADLFNFYVFFEVSMIASFALAAHGRGTREVRSATVFAAANLVGSALFLAGIAALYHLTGTLDLARLQETLPPDRAEVTMLPGALLFVALGLKLGLFPFHVWLPPVYSGARPAVAAILSGAVANIGSYGILRLGADLFGGMMASVPALLRLVGAVLLALGAASVLFGGIMAASRRVVGEVLAYSAIGQVGYVLLAVAAGGPLGVAAAVVYAAVNSLNKTLLFLTRGLGGRVAAAAFVVGALSVAGVPPTAGFVGKVELFRVGLDRQSPWLAALVAGGAVLSLIYMFQAYQHTYWVRRPRPEPSTPGRRAAATALLLLVLAGGLWPEPLLAAGRAAAAALGTGP